MQQLVAPLRSSLCDNLQRLRLLWWGLALLQIPLLLHLQQYMSLPKTGESLSFRALALLIVALAGIVILFAIWITPTRLEKLRQRIHLPYWPYFVFGTVVMAAFGYFIRQEWIYPHILYMLAATLTLVYWTFFESHPLSHHWLWIVLIVIITSLVLFLRVYGLTVYPRTDYTGEPWTLGWAVSYNRDGYISDAIMLGLNGVPRYDVPHYYVLVAYWLRLVGVGFWEARMFGFLLAILTLVITVLAVKNLFDPVTALFTGGALVASAILISGARIRHDIGLGLAIAASLWLYSLALKHKKDSWHFFAGLVMGLGGFAHYHAILFSASMVVGLYGLRYLDRIKEGRFWPERAVWFYILGGLFAASGLVIVQMLPNVEQFFTNSAPNNPDSIATLFNAILKHMRIIGYWSFVESVLIAIALIAAFFRRNRMDRSMLIILILCHISLGIMAEKGFADYVIPLAPLYGFMVGRLFSVGLDSRQRNVSLTQGKVLGFTFFVIAGLSFTLIQPLRYVMSGEPLHMPVPATAQWLRDHADPEQVIIGSNYYYLWLSDYRYGSPLIPSHCIGECGELPSAEAVWDSIGVDYFVFNTGLMREQDLFQTDYLETRHYKVVAEFQDGEHVTTIYQHDIPAESSKW